MNLIHNEQIKLRSAFLNGLALIFFSAGVLAPVISAVYFTLLVPIVGVAMVLVALRFMPDHKNHHLHPGE
jgi:uncharacterized membrane protein